MKRAVFKTAYILTWPLLFLYAPLRVRSRILVIKNDTFLGVRHYFGTNVWSLPGGGVKAGESYKDAATRELNEELGIVVVTKDVHELLGVRTYNERGLFMRYVIFVVKIHEDIKMQKNNEISEVRWLSPQATGASNHALQAVQQAIGQAYLIK